VADISISEVESDGEIGLSALLYVYIGVNYHSFNNIIIISYNILP
jgi:hypothetical protein